MYLARGILNPRSRDVQRDLSDPAELHRTLMKLYPCNLGDCPRRVAGVLHRVDEDRRRGEIVLFVQSHNKPDFGQLAPDYFASVAEDLDRVLAGDAENPQIRSVAEERKRIVAGNRFVFRLRANTTRKIDTKTGVDGTRRNGRRVPVRGDQARIEWLGRHAEAAGFRVTDETLRVAEIAANVTRRVDGIALAGTLFEGVLQVVDPGPFRSALETGIGPGKAFGFGLLSIRSIA